ncbi:hypothetical protein HZS_7123 [Henneguya salminicola]|nr:hypothetical protein HZS_7123 [Henneguya salminicola]
MHKKISAAIQFIPQFLAPMISGLSSFLLDTYNQKTFTSTDPSRASLQHQQNYISYLKNYLSSVTYTQYMEKNRKYDLMVITGGLSKGESVDNIKKTQFFYNSSDISNFEVFGEDSAFTVLSSRYSFFGIADGVGGYRKYRIDPSLFSSTLMKLCLNKSLTVIKNYARPNCKKIIDDGYNQLLSLQERIYGGSTINISCFDHRSGELSISNLGDSRVMVIQPTRNQIFTTNSQQHHFNCPYQLSNTSDDIVITNFTFKQFDSEQYSLQLHHGDIIIIGTDGFFDNMSPEDIIEITKKYNYGRESFPIYYHTLLDTARKYAFDPLKISPFGLEHLEQKKQPFLGGKRDDITLIVAVVVERINQ